MRPLARLLPPGWFNPLDVAEYRYLVRSLPDKATMIEVGVFLGRSLCSVADLIREKQIRLVAVDTFTKKTMAQRPLNVSQRATFEQNMRAWNLHPTVYEMPSMEAAVQFPGKADFVFLDADHVYPAVLAEIAAWRPKTTRVMGGHDYLPSPTPTPTNGVRRAVRESFSVIHLRGWVWSAGLA